MSTQTCCEGILLDWCAHYTNMLMESLHVLHICFFCGGKFRLSVCKSMNPLFDTVFYRSTLIRHTLSSYTQTRTTLFLLSTKSYIAWRKIGVWRNFHWKSIERKSLKPLVTSRSFRLYYLQIGNLLLNRLHRLNLHDSLILWLHHDLSSERYCDTP